MACYNLTIDELVNEVTAARTLVELELMMGGTPATQTYRPTLRPSAGRARSTQLWNSRVEELASTLEGMGWKVFRGLK